MELRTLHDRRLWHRTGDLETRRHVFIACQTLFPSGSDHSSHSIIMRNTKCYKRTNTWIRDSFSYSWRCDSKIKANRMTLLKTVGGKQVVVARYV